MPDHEEPNARGLFGGVFARGGVEAGDTAWLQAMLDTEAALTRGGRAPAPLRAAAWLWAARRVAAPVVRSSASAAAASASSPSVTTRGRRLLIGHSLLPDPEDELLTAEDLAGRGGGTFQRPRGWKAGLWPESSSTSGSEHTTPAASARATSVLR